MITVFFRDACFELVLEKSRIYWVFMIFSVRVRLALKESLRKKHSYNQRFLSYTAAFYPLNGMTL